MEIRLPTPSDSGSCGVCCISEPCVLTVRYTDVNQCEDDAFDVSLLWKDATGEQQSRSIGILDGLSSPAGCCGTDSSGNPCPTTVRELPLTIQPSEVGGCCQIEIKLTLDHTNCCDTFATFDLIGPGGTVSSSTFGQGGLDQNFDVRDICNPAP